MYLELELIPCLGQYYQCTCVFFYNFKKASQYNPFSSILPWNFTHFLTGLAGGNVCVKFGTNSSELQQNRRSVVMWFDFIELNPRIVELVCRIQVSRRLSTTDFDVAFVCVVDKLARVELFINAVWAWSFRCPFAKPPKECSWTLEVRIDPRIWGNNRKRCSVNSFKFARGSLLIFYTWPFVFKLIVAPARYQHYITLQIATFRLVIVS